MQFVGSVLKAEYNLSMLSKSKSIMNVDDLLQLLHHHWVLSTDYYPVERERVQHALIILFMACTTARPSTLVEGGGYYDTNDCLKYKDIEMFKIRDPDNPCRQVF